METNDTIAALAAQKSDAKSEAKKIERKAPKKSDVDVILTAFRRIYGKQLNRTTSTKKEALKAAFEKKHSTAYSYAMFEQEISKRIDLLLSDIYFIEDCSEAGVDPFVAASHYVLAGWQTLSDYILRRNDYVPKPSSEWNEAMFEFDRMKFCESHIESALHKRAGGTLALPACNTAVAN